MDRSAVIFGSFTIIPPRVFIITNSKSVSIVVDVSVHSKQIRHKDQEGKKKAFSYEYSTAFKFNQVW
jgi:hypothetical protein